ncbi:glycerol-3-phosphate responsive antiterminator [Priestia koreensis]|uniref:glycerol-3-phosphate responsive antiterminator n=1 Tax=Priestia koreensis TaxID=284581 RepID=UPI00345828E6
MDVHEEFLRRLHKDRLIASIKDPKSFDYFLETNIQLAFLLMGNISVIKRYVDALKRENRFVFLHIEKIPGISYDREGLKFIANFVKPTGIVSTKSSLIQLAKKEGLLTIQRLFLVDTDAVAHGLKVANDIQPDALELMPGLIPEMVMKVREEASVPIITGGLIRNKRQAETALESGAAAISTGSPRLWKSSFK